MRKSGGGRGSKFVPCLVSGTTVLCRLMTCAAVRSQDEAGELMDSWVKKNLLLCCEGCVSERCVVGQTVGLLWSLDTWQF